MMENAIGSIFSGVEHVLGKIFSSQLDFISGKHCSSVCGPTWDLTCYIEHFCINHLLKLFLVSFLFYIVLLLLYSLYKLGICHCICRISCKLVWACLSTFFSAWGHCCRFLCHLLCTVERRQRRRRTDVEMLDLSSSRSDRDTDPETSFSYRNSGRRRRLSLRDHKRSRLRRSLRARTHRVRLGVDGDSVYVTKRKHIKHGDLRVIRTSSFARRGPNPKRSKHLPKRM